MFELTVSEHVATIEIRRNERRNAVPLQGWLDFERAVRAANMTDARIIVIRSADPESFCAGADLSELVGLQSDEKGRQRFRGAITAAFSRLASCNKPTLAIVSGGCFGIGVSLAAACDLRVATSGASFSITPARFGMSYPEQDLQRLVALVGPGQAARLVYMCETIDGREAARIGLVEMLDDGPDLGAQAIATMLANSPASLCALKATLLGRFGVNQRFDAAFAHREFAIGMKAHGERRAPTF